jgi:hypothetical protein
MSSDSGESHSSAHNHHGDDMEIVESAQGIRDAQKNALKEGATDGHEGEEEDADELQSIDGGTEGLTFARTRRSIPQEDAQDTASELLLRPNIERPQSAASSEIPDDTPSIQVCSQTRAE